MESIILKVGYLPYVVLCVQWPVLSTPTVQYRCSRYGTVNKPPEEMSRRWGINEGNRSGTSDYTLAGRVQEMGDDLYIIDKLLD